MTAILRVHPTSKASRILLARASRRPVISTQSSRRTYSWSSYGADGDPNASTYQQQSRTRELEHPGPPPPKISKESAPPSGPSPPPPSRAQPQPQPGSTPPPESTAPAQKPPHEAAIAAGTAQPPQAAPQIPSNKAHPTLTDGRQSPNVDEHGNLKPDVPDDVRRHNRELESRYDRAYNQIGEDGQVQKGWWSQDRHFEPSVEEQENRFVRWWPRG
ncbi:hypothetical protein VTN00DRAFT_8010 [Thermoascus crustaceus]|uniref:uncharacterized protein n=1 Tax=Thermoascus crustaceus TaxID=5088 RepID=UPI0037440701